MKEDYVYKDLYSTIFSKEPGYCFRTVNPKEPKHRYTMEFMAKYGNEINSMVDIGAGRGAIVKYFLDNYPNVDVLSTDLENYHSYPTRFQAIDLSADTFELDKVYDLVTCYDVIEHLPEPHSVNILTKLRPYGKYFLYAIANHSDVYKGHQLHLTRRDKKFWDAEISKHYEIISSEPAHNNLLYMYVLK